MKLSLRFLLPCLLAGSGLLLLSGCGERDDRYGREYHRHAYVEYREGRPYDYYGGVYYGGPRYETYRDDRYYSGDRYDRRDRGPRYVDNSRVVVDVDARRGSAPYAGHTHSGYTPRGGTRTPPPGTNPAKPKGKDKKKEPYPPRP